MTQKEQINKAIQSVIRNMDDGDRLAEEAIAAMEARYDWIMSLIEDGEPY